MSELKDQGYEAKTVDTTNISDWDPQVFSDMVDDAVRANTVMRDVTAQVNRQLVGSPGSSIDIRERGNVSAGTLSEGASASSNVDSDVSHSKVNVSVSKVGVSTTITREAEEDAMGDQMDETAVEHGEALADKNDQDAYDTLNDDTLSNIEQITVGTDGEIAYADVKDGMVAVLGNDYDPDTLLIHPDFLGDLLGESKFIDASQFGGDDPIREGRIASFIGLDVYLSTNFNASSTTSGDTQAIVFDSERALVEAVKREPTTEMEFDEDQDQWQIVSTMRYGHNVLNDEAVALLENA